ncbi:hypothetical protein [Burkholderia pyrrocinia]|uniref:hypothetical protein n=1 Tax=Burkholderia pyrrocinia TaxID=60550 RepID=UPI0012600CA3|nr:hypothetical protein [Burkholderia pyrrocinia]
MQQLVFVAARGPLCAVVFHFYSPCAAMPISYCPGNTGSHRSIDNGSRGSSTWSCVFPDALRPSFPQVIPKPAPSVCSWNRPVVTSSTAVPTLTQRAGHPGQNPDVSRVPAIPAFSGRKRDAGNVSDLIYPLPHARQAGTLADVLHKGRKKFRQDFPERGNSVACRAFGGV